MPSVVDPNTLNLDPDPNPGPKSVTNNNKKFVENFL